MWTTEQIAERVARDIPDGWTVNLGIGMPVSVAGPLQGRRVLIHSENGILGMGGEPPEGQQDPDLISAGKGFTTLVPGGAIIDSSVSFSLIRGGRLDLSVMGAYQVSVDGDLANWRLPDRRIAGIGGAADLAVGAKRVWVTMKLRAKTGELRVVDTCTYPITARGCVSRVYSDMAVFVRGEDGMKVVDVAPDVDVDELCEQTHASPALGQQVEAAS